MIRRPDLLGVLVVLAALACAAAVGVAANNGQAAPAPFPFHVELPSLPYAYTGLEPVFSEFALTTHHQKHHAGYTNRLLGHLEELWRWEPELLPSEHELPPQNSLQPEADELQPFQDELVWLVLSRAHLIQDEQLRNKIHNDGGGFLNHNLFWRIMRPPVENNTPEPGSELALALDEEFLDFPNFQKEFSQAAASLFGSGWTFLVLNSTDSRLHIANLPNQDTFARQQHFPLLTLDVWEHSYYLDFQSQRPLFISRWWSTVNWDVISKLYSAAKETHRRRLLEVAEAPADTRRRQTREEL